MLRFNRAQGRDRRRDAGIVGNVAVFDRHIEIDTYQHTLIFQIDVADRLFIQVKVSLYR